MHECDVVNLDACTEFRLAVQARPPQIVHGTVALLAALLTTVLGWSAMTRVNLVVRCSGRVRAATSSSSVVAAIGGRMGGRVVEVNVHEGDHVREGDVLVRLDTGRLDNEIANRQRTLLAREDELARLDQLKTLLNRQWEQSRAKAQAELAHALDEEARAAERRASELRLVQLEVDSTDSRLRRLQQLEGQGAASPSELSDAVVQAKEALERLERARQAAKQKDSGVLRQAVDLVETDFALRLEELEVRRASKLGETDAVRTELANLQIERGEAVLRAPIRGFVTAGDVKVGDLLEPGELVMEIAPDQGKRFEVTVVSQDVAQVKVGMPAQIKLDAFDYQKYGTVGGRVLFVSPDARADERFGGGAYVVRIEIPDAGIGRGDARGTVKLGMSGYAEIVIGQERVISLLVNRARRAFSLG